MGSKANPGYSPQFSVVSCGFIRDVKNVTLENRIGDYFTVSEEKNKSIIVVKNQLSCQAATLGHGSSRTQQLLKDFNCENDMQQYKR